jgi:imidazolonepropionase-like amidohydrolase
VLGLDDVLGSLEAGKAADCIVVDGDILDPRSHVLTTIVNGQIAWRLEGPPRI